MDDLRILIADDHAVLRDGLKALVNAQPDMKVIAEAENGRIALQKTRELQPDVVVMDVSMPEMNGAQATQRLKQICPEIKCWRLLLRGQSLPSPSDGSGRLGFPA